METDSKSFWAIATFAFTGSILDYVVITLLPEYLDYVQGRGFTQVLCP